MVLILIKPKTEKLKNQSENRMSTLTNLNHIYNVKLVLFFLLIMLKLYNYA